MWFLVTLVAAVHYIYMRVHWVQVHQSTFVHRYVDWSLAVPLQKIVFNLILEALKTSPQVVPRNFWSLLCTTCTCACIGCRRTSPPSCTGTSIGASPCHCR